MRTQENGAFLFMYLWMQLLAALSNLHSFVAMFQQISSRVILVYDMLSN